MYKATKVGLPKILGLSPNRINVGMLRTLNIQVSHQANHQTFQSILTILDKFQLSIQELHLSFYGQDLHGNVVKTNGCGHSPKRYEQNVGLPAAGQNLDIAFAFLRQITNLRNLRILHIENMNLPGLSSILLRNKKHLQAVCLLTDPRAQVPEFKNVYRQNPSLFRGLLSGPHSKPPVRVLDLDANTLISAESLVNTLLPDLQHFSWRVPSYDYQEEPETCLSSFEHITCNIISRLPTRATDLKTLRLCVTRRASSPQRSISWELSHINQTLAQHLPRFMSLEHFEIHDSYADRFYNDTLIDSLPYGLKRLYISERLINIDVLVEGVRQRYISSHAGVEIGSSLAFDDDLNDQKERQEDGNKAVYLSIGRRGHIRFHDTPQIEGYANDPTIRRSLSVSKDYLADSPMLGEARFREDFIALNTGKLGFITFDYDISVDDHQNVRTGNGESIRTKIFRLNGQLLDREHNMHLASTQDRGQSPSVGIKPKYGKSSDESSGKSETETHSAHLEIHQALHAMSQLRWHDHHITEATADLENCFDESMDWYFGTEGEAEEVFRNEIAAPAEGQRQKSILIEVEKVSSEKCQWSAPEYVVPAVGSFPAPIVPRDWRDDIRRDS